MDVLAELCWLDPLVPHKRVVLRRPHRMVHREWRLLITESLGKRKCPLQVEISGRNSRWIMQGLGGPMLSSVRTRLALDWWMGSWILRVFLLFQYCLCWTPAFFPGVWSSGAPQAEVSDETKLEQNHGDWKSNELPRLATATSTTVFQVLRPPRESKLGVLLRPLTQAQRKKMTFPQRPISKLGTSPFTSKNQQKMKTDIKRLPFSPTCQCYFLIDISGLLYHFCGMNGDLN